MIMNTKFLLSVVLMSCLLTSCLTAPFYQVYKVDPGKDIELKKNKLVYEDDNCIVSYDLWSDGGNVGFVMYNKTSENLFLNLQECFFVLNGVAYDYFKNRVYTNSNSKGVATTASASLSKSMTGINRFDLIQTNKLLVQKASGSITSTGFALSYHEQAVVCIPANTSKYITEYNINNSIYRDCELFKYPTKKQINTVKFNRDNSPYLFSNRLVYFMGNPETKFQFENEFYVTEITNYPESEITDSRHEEYCKQESFENYKFFKNVTPYKFYIKYSKGDDSWVH